MKRRRFLGSAGASAIAMFAGGRTGAGAPMPGWRTFEVTTRLAILEPRGATRAWVPLPLGGEAAWHRRMADDWTSNGAEPREWRDKTYGARVLCAEWAHGVKDPVLTVTSRFATRDRAVDLGAAPPAAAVPEALGLWRKPTSLIPTDGIVARTAGEITAGRRTDMEKARAIYDWIVDNTFRDPKVRGCGRGDIRAMLETRNLGGKCADLNALFVGLARAAGVPARDVYGLRVAESAEFKSLGRAGDVTKAQHCRAEFHDSARGWVPVDPADVRKVVLEEPPGGRTLDDPVVQRARQKLFGAWEMNFLAYNFAHDLELPGAKEPKVPFLMYPQAETAGVRRDPLEPPAFRYEITSREIVG